MSTGRVNRSMETLPDEARRRADVLAPLLSQNGCSRPAARQAAAQLGISERMVYALLQRLRSANGDKAALAPAKPTGGRGRSRLPADVERVLQEAVEQA